MIKTSTESQVTIRRAVFEEARQIGELALRSKAYWGYDAEFMAACRPLLMLPPEYIAGHPVFVIEAQGEIVGFYSLAGVETEVELDHLFIDPSAIGRGYGKRLFRHAVATAAQLGFRQMVIESDPHAEPFYQTMGAVRFGERLSSVGTDRRLPLLRLNLEADQG
ncbi:MAG: GNAT family N-acetyltransferase [Chloroflexi bacterium]|nr:GNAT family N-acetyltransferase [Chloroflexota bacterium]